MICNVINSFMDPVVMGLYVGVLFLNNTNCFCPSCISTECIKLYSAHREKRGTCCRVGFSVQCIVFATPSSTGTSYPHHWKDARVPVNEVLLKLDYHCRGRWNGSSLTRRTEGCRWTLTGDEIVNFLQIYLHRSLKCLLEQAVSTKVINDKLKDACGQRISGQNSGKCSNQLSFPTVSVHSTKFVRTGSRNPVY